MFTITDSASVQALMNAICYMKFNFYDDPETGMVAGSPIIAKFLFDGYDFLKEEAAKKDISNPVNAYRLANWGKHRIITSMSDSRIEVTKFYIKSIYSHWISWDETQKSSYIKNVLSPALAADEIVAELLKEELAD